MSKEIGTSERWRIVVHTKNGKKVVVKMPRFTVSSIDIEYYSKRARVWQKLNHKNIVRLYKYDPNTVSFIIEYCEKNLRQIARILARNIDFFVSLIIQIAEALEYVHRMGIVHGDIKPENILICDNIPKISDWETSIILLEDDNKLYYTPGYLPENIKSIQDVDQTLDIYQLGVLMYEILEGKLPEKTREYKNTPLWLRKIIERCLSEKNRYLTIRELIIDLKSPKIQPKQIKEIETPKPITHPETKQLSPIDIVRNIIQNKAVFTISEISRITELDEESVGNILLAEAIPSKREGYFYSQQFWENGAKKVREIIQKAIMTKKSIEKIVGILEEDIDNIIAKTKTVNIDGYITSIDFLEKLAQEYHNNKVSEIAKILRIPYQTLAKMLIRTWLAKAEIGEVKITLSHDAAVTAYAFSPNAKYIATASKKDKIVIWNAEKMEPHATFPNRYHIHAIVFSPNSRLLALRGNDQLIIIDISQKAIITQRKYNDYYGKCWMAFTPDSKK